MQNFQLQETSYKTKSKHIKGSKERFLLGQKHNLQIVGVIPFIKLKTTLKQQLNGEKRWKMR